MSLEHKNSCVNYCFNRIPTSLLSNQVVLARTVNAFCKIVSGFSLLHLSHLRKSILVKITHASEPYLNIGMTVAPESFKAAFGESHFNLNLLIKAKRGCLCLLMISRKAIISRHVYSNILESFRRVLSIVQAGSDKNKSFCL